MSQPKSLLPRTANSHEGGNDLRLPLFVHVAQLEDEFVANLLGHAVTAEPARLEGHRSVQLADLAWTILVPDESKSVDGLVYRDLSAEDFRRLDSYGGVMEGLYERVVATVRANQFGEEEAAWVYVPTQRTLQRYSTE